MKTTILFLLLTFCTVLSAKKYYVSTTGSDGNPGTIDRPWATWDKAFSSKLILPGDTVYFRGGVYYLEPSEAFGPKTERSGIKGSPIYYLNYPGEKPILDGDRVTTDVSAYTSKQRRGVQIFRQSYLYFKGLTVRNIKQIDGETDTPVGWYIGLSSNITFDNCVAQNIWGIGFKNENSDRSTFLNCDAYDCVDWITSVPVENPAPGNDGSGYNDHNRVDTKFETYYINCRAWRCGDQGFSTGSIGLSHYDGCWSWDNGKLEGGGHGFKMGWIVTIDETITNRVYKNCIAINNRQRGFDTNDQTYQSGSYLLINNISYANKQQGFIIFNTISPERLELRREYYNNIAYDNVLADVLPVQDAVYTHSNNSWDSGITLSDDDFISLDSTGISAPRKPDGSLPDIDFLKLAPGSRAIDAGVNVGLPFTGKAPDLGWHEFKSQTIVEPIKIATYTLEDATNKVSIAFYAPRTTTINIKVLNNAGSQVISKDHYSIIGDNNKVEVDLTGLPPGAYTIRLIDGSTSDTCTVTTLDKAAIDTFEIVKSFPNPTTDLFAVQFYSPSASNISLNVADETGQIVLTNNIPGKKGMNKIVLDMSTLEVGIYRVKVKNGTSEKNATVSKLSTL